MPDVQLLDIASIAKTYEDIQSIDVPTPDGGTVTFYASGGGGGGAEFSINVGDSVSSVFFNTQHSTTALDEYLGAINYPYTDTSTGLPYNILLTATGNTPLVYIASLPIIFNNAKIIYSMGPEGPIIFYSTAQFDASAIIPGLTVSQGWQMNSFSAGFEVEITYIENNFIAIKDTYFAKSAEAYGEWSSGGGGITPSQAGDVVYLGSAWLFSSADWVELIAAYNTTVSNDEYLVIT